MTMVMGFAARQMPDWPLLQRIYGLAAPLGDWTILLGDGETLSGLDTPDSPQVVMESVLAEAVRTWAFACHPLVEMELTNVQVVVSHTPWSEVGPLLEAQGVPGIDACLGLDRLRSRPADPPPEMPADRHATVDFPHPDRWTDAHAVWMDEFIKTYLPLTVLRLQREDAALGFAAWEREFLARRCSRAQIDKFALDGYDIRDRRFYLATQGEFLEFAKRENARVTPLVNAWLMLGPSGGVGFRDFWSELGAAPELLGENDILFAMRQSDAFDDLATRWSAQVGNPVGDYHIARIRASRGGSVEARRAAAHRWFDVAHEGSLGDFELCLEWLAGDDLDICVERLERFAREEPHRFQQKTQMQEGFKGVWWMVESVAPHLLVAASSMRHTLRRLGATWSSWVVTGRMPEPPDGIPLLVWRLFSEITWPTTLEFAPHHDAVHEPVRWFGNAPQRLDTADGPVLVVGETVSGAPIHVRLDKDTLDPEVVVEFEPPLTSPLSRFLSEVRTPAE